MEGAVHCIESANSLLPFAFTGQGLRS